MIYKGYFAASIDSILTFLLYLGNYSLPSLYYYNNLVVNIYEFVPAIRRGLFLHITMKPDLVNPVLLHYVTYNYICVNSISL